MRSSIRRAEKLRHDSSITACRSDHIRKMDMLIGTMRQLFATGVRMSNSLPADSASCGDSALAATSTVRAAAPMQIDPQPPYQAARSNWVAFDVDAGLRPTTKTRRWVGSSARGKFRAIPGNRQLCRIAFLSRSARATIP